MPQRTLGRSFVQPGNVENTGAAPRHLKVTSVFLSQWLSRPRVLYIPFSVRGTTVGLRWGYGAHTDLEAATACQNGKGSGTTGLALRGARLGGEGPPKAAKPARSEERGAVRLRSEEHTSELQSLRH